VIPSFRGVTVIRVNTSDGATLAFDLEDEGDAVKWKQVQADTRFQRSVRAVSVVLRGPGRDGRHRDRAVFACPTPEGRVRNVTWDADLVRDEDDHVVRERVHCYAGNVHLVLNVFRRRNPPWCTVDLFHPGRRVLLPPALIG
jgi:hypothetical protein